MQNFTRILKRVLIPDSRIFNVNVIRNRVGSATIKMEQFPFIPASKVKELLEPKKLTDVIEDALMQFSKRQGVEQPVRSVLPVKHDGFFGVMPAYAEAAGCLGAKLVTFYAGNATDGVHSTHHAVVVLFDPATGVPLVMMDGEVITGLRTAAASAVAVRHLSDTASKILCIVGTGNQARSHAQVLVYARKFQEIRVWGRSAEKTKKCIDDIKAYIDDDISIIAYSVLSEAVSGADVVAAVTMTSEAVLHGEWLKPGALVCSVGAVRPNWRELDDHVMHNGWVIVDSREGALKESGDILLSKAEIFAELGEIAAGTKKLPPFDQEKKFTVFKSLGMAIEDVYSAKLVYDLSRQQQ